MLSSGALKIAIKIINNLALLKLACCLISFSKYRSDIETSKYIIVKLHTFGICN